MGSDAGKALAALRWKDSTAEERSEHARMMLRARWAKWRARKAAQRKVRKKRKGGAR